MNMDINTNQVSYAVIEGLEKIRLKGVIDNMMVDGSDIYWLEYDGQRLVKYSVVAQKCEFYDMPSVEMKSDECFAAVFMYNKKIYAFPRHTPYLIVFDITKKQFTKYDEVYKKNEIGFPKECEAFFWRSTQSGNMVFLLCRQENKVIEYCLDNGNIKVYLLPEKVKKPANIIYGVDSFYLSCADSSIYILDKNFNNAEKIYMPKSEKESFLDMSLTKHNLFFLPSLSEEIIIIDLKSLNVSYLDNYPDDFKYNGIQWSKYYKSCQCEKYIWYANRSANYILRIDKERELAEWIKMKMPSLKEEANYYFLKAGDGILYENEKNVEILFENIERKSNRNSDICIGNNIWQVLNR